MSQMFASTIINDDELEYYGGNISDESENLLDEIDDLDEMFQQDNHLINYGIQDILSESRISDPEIEGKTLSLDEIPFDRDIRYINVAVGSRPRPKMLVSTELNRQIKNVSSMTSSTSKEVKELDEHYKKLDRYKKQYVNKSGNGKAEKLKGSKNKTNPGDRHSDSQDKTDVVKIENVRSSVKHTSGNGRVSNNRISSQTPLKDNRDIDKIDFPQSSDTIISSTATHDLPVTARPNNRPSNGKHLNNDSKVGDQTKVVNKTRLGSRNSGRHNGYYLTATQMHGGTGYYHHSPYNSGYPPYLEDSYAFNQNLQWQYHQPYPFHQNIEENTMSYNDRINTNTAVDIESNERSYITAAINLRPNAPEFVPSWGK